MQKNFIRNTIKCNCTPTKYDIMYYSALDFRNIQPIPVPVTPQPLPRSILLVSKNRKCVT